MQRPGFHLAWKKAQTRVKKEVKRVLFHVKTLDELSEAISKANQQDQTKIVVDSDICIGGIDNVKQSRFEDIAASLEIDGGGHILQGEGIGIGLVIYGQVCQTKPG